MRSLFYLCVDASPHNFLNAEPIFMKLGMYIMTPMLITTAYFTDPSHQSVYMCILHALARQRIYMNLTTATNTHAIEELLNACFGCDPCRTKAGTRLFLPRIVCYTDEHNFA
jgi:hypothetical protein